MNLKSYIKAINSDGTVDTISKLADAGFDRDEIRDALPELIDELVMFNVLIPGPAGAILEAVDGPAIKAIVDILFPVLWRKHEKRRAKVQVP